MIVRELFSYGTFIDIRGSPNHTNCKNRAEITHKMTYLYCTANNSAPYRTTWCNAVCNFIKRKPHKPHHTLSLYINIYLFLILNILLIV